MKFLLFSTISSLACVATASLARPGVLLPPLDEDDLTANRVAAALVTTTGDGYFEQLLDHDDPSKGTFKQKYWWNSEFYAGPGSPVRQYRLCWSETYLLMM